MAERLVDLLRHGETPGGARFRGRGNDPLTPRGWRQMEATLAICVANWTCVVHSPARRCAVFAQEWAARRQVPAAMWDAFAERDFGAWEDCAPSAIPLSDLTRFWEDPGAYDPPGAEPFATFQQRVLDGWRALCAADEMRHALLIAHGGVIRVLIGAVLGLTTAALPLLEVPHASLSRVRLPTAGGRPSLVFHGLTPFADGAAA